MFCSKCGKLVTDDMKFCSSCGEKIEIFNEAESIIPTPTKNVITNKSPVNKKVIFIAMVAIVILGLIVTNFIINRPISGPEVLYDLKWGMTYEQVKAVDSKIRTQEIKQLNSNERGVFLSTIDYNYMHIDSKYDGATITYHFGANNSLEKIEIQYGANEEVKYDYIMKKLEEYYNAVCKTSPTKGKAAHGNNQILIWNTSNNQISVGGDFDRTDYVTATITPLK